MSYEVVRPMTVDAKVPRRRADNGLNRRAL